MKASHILGFFVGAPLMFLRARDATVAKTDAEKFLYVGAGVFLLVWNGRKLGRS